MAIISLRAYNREIEGMIDNGQLDEAVAHCRHILATFPKHIASYRLLGKAHLEQQRISDATDIFQRVLSAIPDDFISNVGMSIIREDENNLDASIWHMELAYEAQPANIAIQDELRRLYGRRDGMQPPKVRLTRGALARMYAKGGLFDQAIAELRAAIAEDPNRPDLQLLLAQMLYQTSQRVEAVDAAMNILKKMPLCLEANRLLAVCLPDAEGSDKVKNSRQIVISMDPYYAFAEADAISSDQVPENAVNIERLEWKSGIQINETPEQPSWATSLGISMEKPAEENIPDWLKAAEAPLPAQSSNEKATPAVSPFIWDTQEVEKIITDTSKPEGEIPDWMKDAGWKPATTEIPPVPIEPLSSEELNADVSVSDDLVQADIPEWLRGIAPDGFMGAEGQQTPDDKDQLSNPWLEPHQPGPTDSIIQWLDEKKPVTSPTPAEPFETKVSVPDDEVPDWLKDLDLPPAVPNEEDKSVLPAAAFTAGIAAFLDTTEKSEPASAGPAPVGAQIEPVTTTPPEQVASLPIIAPAGVEEPPKPAEEEELPDWLKDISVETPAAELPIAPQTIEAEPLISPVITPPAEQVITAAAVLDEEQPAQVEEKSGVNLSAVAGAVLAAEILSKPEAEKPPETTSPAEEIPAIEKTTEVPPIIMAAAVAEGISNEVPTAASEEIPVSAEISTQPIQPALTEPEFSSVEPELANEPEAFAWLKGLTDEQDAQSEQLIIPGPEGELPPPEWVKLDMEPVTGEFTTPEAEAGKTPPAEPAQEVPDWIKGLGEEPEAEQTVEEAASALPTPDENLVEEELPAWLVELEQPAPEKETTAAAEEPLEWKLEEVPDWLKEITESEQAVEATPTKERITPGELAAAAVIAELAKPDESVPEVAKVEEPIMAIPVIEAVAIPEETAQPATPVAEAEQPLAPIGEEAISTVAETIPAEVVEPVVPAELAAQSALADARNAVKQGNLPQATSYYASLIKQNYQIDEIIKDLQDALYRFPVDIEMWVTLGDAHSKTNDLKEALNAYTKAEELVR
jgi:tetratricopeptide (TPR) repeat protein